MRSLHFGGGLANASNYHDTVGDDEKSDGNCCYPCFRFGRSSSLKLH